MEAGEAGGQPPQGNGDVTKRNTDVPTRGVIALINWLLRIGSGSIDEHLKKAFRKPLLRTVAIAASAAVAAATLWLFARQLSTMKEQNRLIRSQTALQSDALRVELSAQVSSLVLDIEQASLDRPPGEPCYWLDAKQLQRLIRIARAARPTRQGEHSEALGDILVGLGGAQLCADRVSVGRGERRVDVFSTIDLSGADARRQILWGPADLRGARLRDADLAGLQLQAGTVLEGADLRGADLTGVQLAGVRLASANLGCAKAPRANFRAADLRGAALHGADLSRAVGLDQGQVERATGDDSTKLPPKLKRPARWSVTHANCT